MTRFQIHLDRRVLMTVKFQVKSEFASQYKVISISEFRLSHDFQRLLLTATTSEISIPVPYAMHDGQHLKHPLS